MELKIIQAMALMLSYIVFCITVNWTRNVSWPFFGAVSEDFIKRYCLVGVPVFYLWSMAFGRFMYYLEDATFRDNKRENDAGLTRSEFILMGLKNMGRVTDAEIHQLQSRYNEERRRR
ncbi:uncharacterized protein LOC120283024 isoform X2 [Dioscorea cayenensis subsp. rotundata]|uniref:Uncharacterized protein LOC120283024 isoform X2 n=1 Tax=Dioscorea cayennensis subsp. rotundata TaxID=55577 RepID=A0AB40D523_DIOCR|nr:uncharacterized protein LOC120283024 isoform X2 [Dioscorea cayenensis subsp. rotundata]